MMADQFSGLGTRKIARAKSFTRAIYSTRVVLLTKRTDVNRGGGGGGGG